MPPTTPPKDTISVAFKEWAAVCGALAAGEQILLLRKGGIHERGGRFEVEHPQFWLLPTYLHEDAAQLTARGRHWLESANRALGPAHAEKPAGDVPGGNSTGAAASDGSSGWHDLDLLAAVDHVEFLDDESSLSRLAGRHVWTDQTIRRRFHYRRPGIFLLLVRIYQIPQPHRVAATQKIAGCRSWVDLPQPLATHGAKPVLDDPDFSSRRQAVLDALG